MSRMRLPRLTRRAALPAIGGVAAVSLFFTLPRLWKQKPRLPGKPVLMLTPLTHSTDTPDGLISAQALDGLLASQLQQSGHLETLSRERVQAAWNRITGATAPAPRVLSTAQAREVAMRAGAQFVVFGNLGRVGDEYILQLRLELLGSDTGSPLAAWPGEEPRNFPARTEAALTQSAHAGADWIRTTAGESYADLRDRSRTLRRTRFGAMAKQRMRSII